MEWETKYIICRPAEHGVVHVVHGAESLKDARYWLQFIAERNDALFTTSLHPKYDGDGTPKYSCHLQKRGKVEYNESSWFLAAFESKEKITVQFVEAPVAELGEDTSQDTQKGFTETEIIELVDGNPKNLSLDQLQQIVMMTGVNLEVILNEAGKWIDWESPLALMASDIKIIGVNPNSEWPLRVSMNSKDTSGQTIDYDKQMQFIVKMTK